MQQWVSFLLIDTDGENDYNVYYRRLMDWRLLRQRLYGQIKPVQDVATFGLQRSTMLVALGTCTGYHPCLKRKKLISFRRYYSAGTANTFDNQHLHVLKGSSNIIWDSTWSYACTLKCRTQRLNRHRYWHEPQPVLQSLTETFGVSMVSALG